MKRFLPVLALLLVGATPPEQTGTGSLKLYGQDPLAKSRPTDSCDQEACKALLGMITGAKQSIDFAIYGLRDQKQIFDALVAAKKRGVQVRGIVDQDIEGKSYYSSTQALIDALGSVHTDVEHDRRMLAEQKPYEPGHELCDRPPGLIGPLQCLAYDLGESCLMTAQATDDEIRYMGDLMHDKFFVVDGKKLWTGSMNVSDSCSGGYNANVVAVAESEEIARWYTTEFEQMYSGKFHLEKQTHRPLEVRLADGTRVEGYFSPQDRPIESALRPLVRKAEKKIDATVFFLTHKELTRDLIDAHRRGVKIRILVDASGATNAYTKIEILRAAGIPVKVETWGGKMHSKAVAIDDDTVVMGSMNWTGAGERGNDENTLVIHSRGAAADYLRHFEHVWKSVPDTWLEGRPDPESKDSGSACFDHVDNDYDGLKDADDPGCGDYPPPISPLPPIRLVPKSSGDGLVKGNIGANGSKVYHLPGSRYYADAAVEVEKGEKYFCSIADARAAGFRAAAGE